MAESKEMEALHLIAKKVELADNDDYWEVRNAYATVEQSLTELQQIKSAEPTKALECLKTLGELRGGSFDFNTRLKVRFEEEFDTIKQALLKAQENDKVLDVIISKNVDATSFKGAVEQMLTDFDYVWYKSHYTRYHT